MAKMTHFKGEITRKSLWVESDVNLWKLSVIFPQHVVLKIWKHQQTQNSIYFIAKEKLFTNKHTKFGKAINIRGGEYGNALLSKFPLQNVCVIPIPDATNKEENVFYESRSIIKAKIVVNNTCFNLLSTHFGLAREEQTNGTKVICDLSKDLQNIIFMGDLNLTPKNINFKTLCENFNNTIDLEKFSFRSDNPTSRIDYIFTSKNLIYENHTVIRTYKERTNMNQRGNTV